MLKVLQQLGFCSFNSFYIARTFCEIMLSFDVRCSALSFINLLLCIILGTDYNTSKEAHPQES